MDLIKTIEKLESDLTVTYILVLTILETTKDEKTKKIIESNINTEALLEFYNQSEEVAKKFNETKESFLNGLKEGEENGSTPNV